MRPFAFLHCGDAHLGAPFRGLADLSAALSERLRVATAEALARAVTVAVERRVAAVLIAGDLFDASDRNLWAQIQLRDQLRRLHEAGIPSFIAAGNHDHLGGTLASIRYPESTHLFGSEVEAIPLRYQEEVVAHVYGVSHTRPDVRDNLAARFPADPKGPFAIALLHANVEGRADHGPYAPCTLADLESRSFDYWALGHVHRRETLRDQRPIVHYPGNPQGLHINETGPRGATLVEVGSGGEVELSPVWTDRVRWHRQRTAIDELPTLDDLMGAFAEVAGTLAASFPDRFHVLRWTLTGHGPLHRELSPPGSVAELTEALRAEHAPEPSPGSVWLERLELLTRPALDLELLRSQQDLLGDLLRLAETVRQSPPRPPRHEIGAETSLEPEPEVSVALRDNLEALLDHPRVRPCLGTDPWSLLDWRRLLARAESLAVEGLAEPPGC